MKMTVLENDFSGLLSACGLPRVVVDSGTLKNESAGHVHRRAEALRESPRLFTRERVANPFQKWAIVFSENTRQKRVFCSTMDCCHEYKHRRGPSMEISGVSQNHSAIFSAAFFFSFPVMCAAMVATAPISTPKSSVKPMTGIGSGIASMGEMK